jgi:hypothetical protein
MAGRRERLREEAQAVVDNALSDALRTVTEPIVEIDPDPIMDEPTAKIAHVATIQVCVDAKTAAEAREGLADILDANGLFIIDWSYLQLGGQYCSPVATVIPQPYEEGDFITKQ